MSRDTVQRVFVVDDEVVIASTLAIILRSQGFETTSFTEPRAALAAAIADPPDMLISDVVLPLFSGIELAIQVRDRFPQCKVLLFSGHAETRDMMDVDAEPTHHFEMLSKPVHPNILLQRVRSIMAGGLAAGAC